MEKYLAKKIHETTNLAYWAEQPDFISGNRTFDFIGRCIRSLPINTYETQKRLFYNTDKVISINGESVVATNGEDKVDKYMFRRPRHMSMLEFKQTVEHETGTMVRSLGGVALETEVGIKPARIFRLPGVAVEAVHQTQEKLDLNVHEAFDLDKLRQTSSSPAKDRSARDMETLVEGTESMAVEHGYYPDIFRGSGNIRRSIEDGALTLIDVMPIYADGGRLVDNTTHILPGTLDALDEYQKFIGEFGA